MWVQLHIFHCGLRDVATSGHSPTNPSVPVWVQYRLPRPRGGGGGVVPGLSRKLLGKFPSHEGLYTFPGSWLHTPPLPLPHTLPPPTFLTHTRPVVPSLQTEEAAEVQQAQCHAGFRHKSWEKSLKKIKICGSTSFYKMGHVLKKNVHFWCTK